MAGRTAIRARALRVLACVVLVIGSAGMAPVHAQAYPTKTIKLVVPFGPGGPTDTTARLIAQIVQSALGQNVVVENRPGAGGATGTKAVAGADPDGYTLLLGTGTNLAVIPALVKSPGYDPIKSFVAIARVAESSMALVVPTKFPANSVQELIAYAKANPGKLSYSSAGPGSLAQLVAELFKSKADVDIVHIPYKSGAEMVTAILSEQVQIAFPDVSVVIPHVREGKLKALAGTSTTRHPQLPDVPTMMESGIPDFVLTFWTGIVAPAGTPSAVVEKLNAAINAGLKSRQIEDTLAKLGAQTKPGSPQDFAAFIAAESGKWRTVAKTVGISAD